MSGRGVEAVANTSPLNHAQGRVRGGHRRGAARVSDGHAAHGSLHLQGHAQGQRRRAPAATAGSPLPTPVCSRRAPLFVSGSGLPPDAPHTPRLWHLRSDLDKGKVFATMAALSGRPETHRGAEALKGPEVPPPPVCHLCHPRHPSAPSPPCGRLAGSWRTCRCPRCRGRDWRAPDRPSLCDRPFYPESPLFRGVSGHLARSPSQGQCWTVGSDTL